jgi:peptidyl-prolyl cis-trans isomerase D
MLQAIRSKAAGIVVRVLFSILVISFAIWGIGDYTFLRRGDTTAVKIGDESVTATALDQEYRNEINRLRRAIGQLDPEMARQLGLMDQIVQRIVTQKLLDKAAGDLGVRIGDDVVRGRLLAAPELQTPAGNFDRARFQQILYENNMNEAGFVAQYRQELARGLLTDALSVGARPPAALVDRLYRYRNERRSGESLFVAASSFTDVGRPDDAQLQSVYDDNRERFTAPEYRSLTVVRIGASEIMERVKVEDRQIEDEYRARLAELRVPEGRDVEQLLFADEPAAKAAHEKLVGGAPFADIAKGANTTTEQARLGTIVREDLLPELAEAAFAVPLNGVSAPRRSPFGWHIFRVTKIEPGREPSFAEMKEKLGTELRLKLAGDEAYEYATKVEDALANGLKLEDAAARSGVPAVKIAAIDPRGRTPAGQSVPTFEGAAEVLTAAFETASGRETQLIEGRDNTWFIVRVDGITPSALRPLAEVRNDAIALWQAEKREAAAKARAEQILASVKSGRTLEAAAAPFNLKPTAIPPTLRATNYDPRAAVPPEVNAQLFSIAVGETAVVPGRDGVHVVRLGQVVPADPAADSATVDQLRAQLQQQIAGDLIGEFADALRQRYGVTINSDVINRLN